MITFKQFLLEGGNVSIDDQDAERIDLSKHERAQITKTIDELLSSINSAFKKQYKKPIWNDALFNSKEFLSGSAFHFFSSKISDSLFKKYKPSVGDIDTQVDKNLDAELKEFLTKNKGKSFGPGTLIGFKTSAGQHISLWKLTKENLNVQIDLEMVDFNDQGNPTEWSQFSHSSPWEDMTKGIKGVAQKYLMRALDAPKLKDVVIKAKTARGSDKVKKSSTTAFSVTHGMRTKLKPVLDASGKHLTQDGLPAYHEMSTTESPGNTSLAEIFKGYFGRDGTKTDIKRMGSFTGLIDLIKETFKKSDQQKIADGFANTLWGEGAQGLYKGGADKDQEEKTAMMSYLLSSLALKDSYSEMRKKFYSEYK